MKKVFVSGATLLWNAIPQGVCLVLTIFLFGIERCKKLVPALPNAI